jgi:protein-disulfide isomerase
MMKTVPFVGHRAILASGLFVLLSTTTLTLAGLAASATRLTVFTDYQCSTCKKFEQKLDDLKSKYGNDISIQFRNFPLAQHKNALKAAYAAEAAASQGRLSQMQQKLFDSQARWAYSDDPVAVFEDLASSISLNVPKFVADLQSERVRKKVAGDISFGKSLAVQKTPTVVINQKTFSGPSLANIDSIVHEQTTN